MLNKFKKHTTKVSVLLAIISTAVVTGAVANLVNASVPDQQGKINACAANSGGTLRIIDTSNESCGQNETAVNWDQNKPAVEMSKGVVNADGTLDTSSLKNIVSYEAVVTDPEVDGLKGYCLELPFAPTLGKTSGPANSEISIKVDYDPNNLDFIVRHYCDSQYNAFVRGDQITTGYGFTIW